MYSNLNLYYLRQLGISPWISKENSLQWSHKEKAGSSDSEKLLVLIPAHCTNKAQVLLQRLIAFLKLKQDEFFILALDRDELGAKAWEPFKNKTPLALLSLGFSKDELQSTHFNCPIITNSSPEHLLQHPSEKKELFKDLVYLQEHILSKTIAG